MVDSGCPRTPSLRRLLGRVTFVSPLKRSVWSSLCLLLVAGLGSGVSHGQAFTAPDEMVVTHNQVIINGKTVRYTVNAGLLPLYNNDTGELMARMFIMAYTVDQSHGAPPRPLTFLWNGGPGSSSSQMHLMGVGPKGFVLTADTYPEWAVSPPAQIGDRPDTWLAVSDLVFVDPIGTGYSRATSERYRDLLYTQWGDGEAVAEMIRVYRTRFAAWDAPLFLAGESYGTTRAMEVAADLERRRTHLTGVVLISGSYDAGQKVPASLDRALEVALFTATGHYHHRLAPELQSLTPVEAVQQAVTWARSDYAPALENTGSLSDAQRGGILQGLKRYTGIDPKLVDPKTLSIGKDQYLDMLMSDAGLELGRYDSRVAAKHRPEHSPWQVSRDPSISPMLDLMEGTSVPLIRYLRDTLRYHSDLLYRGPFGEAFHPQLLVAAQPGIYDDWMAVMWNRGQALGPPTGSPAGATPSGDAKAAEKTPPAATAAPVRAGGEPDRTPRDPPLHAAMEMNPAMLLFNVTGMYDGSCASKDEAVVRTQADIRTRVRNRCYAAGHMVYTDKAVRMQLLRDFSQFVHDATLNLQTAPKGDAR